jgi:Icc-related predicted phosphoesterase
LKLIIHGHVHQSHHYKIGDIDVICNPLGRPLIFPNEGKHFDKDLIIEI